MMVTVTGVGPRRFAGIALIAVLLGVGAGCATEPGAQSRTSVVVVTVPAVPSAPAPTQSSAPSLSPPRDSAESSAVSSAATSIPLAPEAREAADRAAIESQWISFWRAYADIVRVPVDQREGVLAAVATPDLNERMRAAIADGDGSGIDNYGYVKHRIIFPLSIDGAPIASIADCQDQSGTGTVEAATGKVLTAGESRVNIRGEMHKGEDGIWRVHALLAPGGDC